jgi:hypothetical protein
MITADWRRGAQLLEVKRVTDDQTLKAERRRLP